MRVPLYELDGKRPQIHPTAFVAPTASLVGDVTVEAGASVWYGAVLRADMAPIVIGEGTSVQDNSVLHSSPDTPMLIGARCTIGHGVVFHGRSIGDGSLIGNGATVLEWVTVGSGSIVGANSLVPLNMEIPDGVSAMGAPARVKGPVEGMGALILEHNPSVYATLTDRHRDALREVSPSDCETTS